MSAIFDEQQQFVDDGGNPIVNGFIYIGDQGADPKLNPKAIFSDRALTAALANPQRTDANGRSVNKIWTDGRYSMRISDLNDDQLYQELDNGEDAGAVTLSLGNVIGSNAITADASPTITSLDDTAQFIFEVVSENTTDAVTLNIDGLGAKDIKRNFDQDVVAGKFKVNQIVIVAYNSTTDDFEWINENARINTETKGADIASAATVDLATATGNNLDITGHAGPITALGTVIAGVVYRLTFDGSAAVTITSSSIANPTNILCAAVHGLTTSDEVIIAGHSGSVPDINGRHTVTVVDPTNYTIPVNVTTGGTGGTSTGVPAITHNGTSLILPDAADIDVVVGDVMEIQSLGSGNWKATNYETGDGRALVVATQVEAEGAAENTMTMTPLRVAQAIAAYGHPEVFTADGTYNVPEGTTSALVIAAGAGAQGGGSISASNVGGGGGGGQLIKAVVTVTGGGSETVTIGAGGTGAASGVPGNDGDDTTFGSLVTAKGGSGGTSSTPGLGGAGGIGSTTSGTDIAIPFAHAGVDGAGTSGGNGGSAPEEWVDGNGGVGGVDVPTAATLLGSGGAGGGNTGPGRAGADGADGYLIVIPLI